MGMRVRIPTCAVLPVAESVSPSRCCSGCACVFLPACLGEAAVEELSVPVAGLQQGCVQVTTVVTGAL